MYLHLDTESMKTNSRRVLKKVSLTVVLLLSAIAILGSWYRYTHSLRTISHKEINDPKLATKVLIAAEGNKFKDEVVSGVIDKLEHRPIYIDVVDASDLINIRPSEWTAIVIIQTWEMGKPLKEVSDFVKRTNASDIIIVTTSVDGNYHIEGVEEVTSVSKVSDVERCVREILDRIEIKIAPEEISTFK